MAPHGIRVALLEDAEELAAEATVLAREGALRNILGLPPNDCRKIVPVSAPNVFADPGTNPATAAFAGFTVDQVKALNEDGQRKVYLPDDTLKAFEYYRLGLKGPLIFCRWGMSGPFRAETLTRPQDPGLTAWAVIPALRA